MISKKSIMKGLSQKQKGQNLGVKIWDLASTLGRIVRLVTTRPDKFESNVAMLFRGSAREANSTLMTDSQAMTMK